LDLIPGRALGTELAEANLPKRGDEMVVVSRRTFTTKSSSLFGLDACPMTPAATTFCVSWPNMAVTVP